MHNTKFLGAFKRTDTRRVEYVEACSDSEDSDEDPQKDNVDHAIRALNRPYYKGRRRFLKKRQPGDPVGLLREDITKIMTLLAGKEKSLAPPSKLKCFNCQKSGHFARECNAKSEEEENQENSSGVGSSRTS